MSEVDDLRSSVTREIEQCEQYLRRARDIVAVVPIVQERLREAEAKQMVLTQMPGDLLSDLAPGLLSIQLRDQARLEGSLAPLPQTSIVRVSALSASGTMSPFYDAVLCSAPCPGGTVPRLEPVLRAFDDLAQEKVQKARLPAELGRVHPDLGQQFNAAVDSIEKCQGGILGVDQAAIRMRDVIEQLWGGLAAFARCKCSGVAAGRRLELKKEASRRAVAACLSAPDDNDSFLVILDGLWDLHGELSRLSKDPLYQDVEDVRRVSTRWLLLMADLTKFVILE